MDKEIDQMDDRQIIAAFNAHYRQRGLDPAKFPVLSKRYTKEELEERLSFYKEYIDIILFFVNKFLSTIQGTPILVTVTDQWGYLLECYGEPMFLEAIAELGITKGVRYNEETGTGSVPLCLRFKRPFHTLGEEHFFEALHGMACYSAPFHREDGAVLGTLSLMTGVDSAHPHLLTLLCTMVDSVEREMLLRRNNAHLHTLNQVLLEANYQGVVVTDAAGRIIDMNDQYLRMLRLDGGDKHLHLGTPVLEHRLVSPYFERVLARQEECIGVELQDTRMDADSYYMLDVLPVFDMGGCLCRIIGTLRDITEMKRTEEVLRNTEKLVFAGQLAVGIAHEIRNPLTTVKGLIQLAGPTSGLRHYDLIMSELDRMNLIVGEFLILGKPQEIRFREDWCMTILQEVLSLIEIEAAKNNVRIRCTCIREEKISCDRNQIKQVFLNILKNAIQALPGGGRIDIVLEADDGYQRIRFVDNGIGMPEEVLERIGEPFHTTKLEGYGLGMMIVKKIIASHRGILNITSEPGKGTTVEMGLPIG
ncbi:ATP-binding protein [Paenibacillus sp. VMFN-D1]|uniref:ATP-binding protein n=1 Tax=Paenibacillus sp. VMFN-D1 TaxID=2135608 RepID=UPI000E280AFC|nr:ATP-binding protein [Paenibacillus sp. VMFN-D1]